MIHYYKSPMIIMLLCLVKCDIYSCKICSEADCSHQLSSLKDGNCIIHNTTICLHSLSNLSPSSEIELKSEDKAKFSISVIPYSAEVYVHPMTLFLPALNITFTVHQNDVQALAVKITGQEKKPICRLFNFQNLGSNYSLPMNIFYDCFYNLFDSKIHNVEMDFIALPVNEKLSYYVYIPASKSIKAPCNWQPVIMIFCGKLLNGDVNVKFSPAPEHLNVSVYSVVLIEKSSKEEMTLRIPSNQKNNMLSAKFSSVNRGHYSVLVKLLTEGGIDCFGAETAMFSVDNSKFILDTVTVLCICIILVFTLSSFVFMKYYSHSVKLKFGKIPRVLLLYSYDCSQHEDFVVAFIHYLTQQCHLEVSTIYGKGGDPLKWMEEKYKSSDIVIFLISEGLLYTLNQKGFLHVKEGHHWRRQLPKAKNYIFKRLFHVENYLGIKKLCMVCFSYSSKIHIPECLDNEITDCFMLPEEMNSFLYFIHDFHPKIPCTNLYPSLCDKLESSSEGKTLLEKIEAVQAAVDNNSHIQFIDMRDEVESNDGGESDWNSFEKNGLQVKDSINLSVTESISSSEYEENSDPYVREFLSKQMLTDPSRRIFQEVGQNNSPACLDTIKFTEKSEKFIFSGESLNIYESSEDDLETDSLLDHIVENISHSDKNSCKSNF